MCKNGLLISNYCKTTYSYTYYLIVMAGVLERMRRPRKQIVKQSTSMDLAPTRVLELQTAKEILAEIFGTDISDVEEMIQMRCEKLESYPEGLWAEGWGPA